MYNPPFHDYQQYFSNCRRILGKKSWGRVMAALDEEMPPQSFPELLSSLKAAEGLPEFISDLSRLEWHLYLTRETIVNFPQPPETDTVNPSLAIVPLAWKNLVPLIENDTVNNFIQPEPAQVHVIIWRHLGTGLLHIREADNADLLALKIIIEQIDPRAAAKAGDINVRAIHGAINHAIEQGLVLSPGSRIQRIGASPAPSLPDHNAFITADTFTLQWHITQSCDLHCKHCYDRSDRGDPLPVSTAVNIIDDFYDFCRRMHVDGQVTFTGGNPLLYPHFKNVYRIASDRGFGIAILGNPTPIEQIEELIDIAKPLFFQISLEGLAQYNDYIRGKNHFQRSLAFLDQLRKLGIFSMVMLTLTRDNLDQVLPLGKLLENRADFFTFNRLSTVGEGANLKLPIKEDFEKFIRKFEAAAADSPIMGLKDNLINIVRAEKGLAPFGGCTGYGCGAAFNFAALLPDGEVHACRKFPSQIGNILQTRLIDIYHSDIAKKYRRGSEACRDCSLSVVCRGCLAVAHGHGLDIFKHKDPFCFVSEKIYSHHSAENNTRA